MKAGGDISENYKILKVVEKEQNYYSPNFVILEVGALSQTMCKIAKADKVNNFSLWTEQVMNLWNVLSHKIEQNNDISRLDEKSRLYKED